MYPLSMARWSVCGTGEQSDAWAKATSSAGVAECVALLIACWIVCWGFGRSRCQSQFVWLLRVAVMIVVFVGLYVIVA